MILPILYCIVSTFQKPLCVLPRLGRKWYLPGQNNQYTPQCGCYYGIIPDLWLGGFMGKYFGQSWQIYGPYFFSEMAHPRRSFAPVTPRVQSCIVSSCPVQSCSVPFSATHSFTMFLLSLIQPKGQSRLIVLFAWSNHLSKPRCDIEWWHFGPRIGITAVGWNLGWN